MPFDQELINSIFKIDETQDGKAFGVFQVDHEVHDYILERLSKFCTLVLNSLDIYRLLNMHVKVMRNVILKTFTYFF